MQIHIDPCMNHLGSECDSGNLCREWLKEHKLVAHHHRVVTKVTSGTEGRDMLPLDSQLKALRFPHSWESPFCMHHSTLALSVLSPLSFSWQRLFFFNPKLFPILSNTALAVSAVSAIRPSCYSLTHVPSQVRFPLPSILPVSVSLVKLHIWSENLPALKGQRQHLE